MHWFETIDDAIAASEAWRIEYSESRPHQALAEQTPAAFARKQRGLENASGIETAEN
jgi:transposase InsO family protein